METEELKEKVDDITTHVGDYVDTFVKLTALNVTQKVANVASSAVQSLVVCLLGLFVLFFSAAALAWWLGDVVNSRAGGFLIVAGFFFLVTVIIIALRKQTIIPFLRNSIIRKIYE